MCAPSWSFLSASLLLPGEAAAKSAGAHGGCQAVDASSVAHTGETVGKEIVHNNITIYVSAPNEKKNPRTKARASTARL
ncbi:hypothetical protein VTK56DRAFT_5131 [Thermocarpiscus australiensis]